MVAKWPGTTRLRKVGRLLAAGGIVAYPTEGVYGLGCDPLDGAAVERLLALKGRGAGKGLILLASDWRQLEPFVATLPPEVLDRVMAKWPGPTTWVLPARAQTPGWLTGDRTTIAARVTAHPVAAALCRSWGGALVSTSANRSGHPPARSAVAVLRYFGGGVDAVIHGPLGGLGRPTPILDAVSGETLRAG